MNKRYIKKTWIGLFLGISPVAYSQTITTYAGNGDVGYSGNGGQATAAEIYSPTGVALDGFGNIYIADAENDAIRMVNTSGVINTIAGEGPTYPGYSGDGGPATAAELYEPFGVAADAGGNVYIADNGNNRVRKVNTSGIISTFAGTGTAAFSGDGGPATAADLDSPAGLAVDVSGNVYIADLDNDLIRIVNTSGVINTFAGNGYGAPGGGGYSGDGGPAIAAELYFPYGVGVDASGNVYIADKGNDRVRIVNTSGVINTLAGNGYNSPGSGGYSGDGGAATAAELYWPYGVTVDGSGNVYISDQNNQRIREVNKSGVISTFAGNGVVGHSGDGGPATAAELYHPWGVVSDALGDVYIGDNDNNRVRKVTLPTLGVLANTPTGISCYGESNGSGSVTVNGGTIPYTYSWSPEGGTNSSATGLSAGTYTVTVTDNSNVSNSVTVTISQPAALEISIAVETNISCNGSNGSATANLPTGGTLPYTYDWSPSGGTNLGASLSAGSYTITVTDNHGCTASASVVVTEPPPLSAGALVTGNETCFGEHNGIASASSSGGTSPYTYSWSGGETGSTASGLSAGTYTLSVSDNCGATETIFLTITQPAALNVTPGAIKNCCYEETNGSAAVTVSGGSGRYRYTWAPTGQTTATISGLSPGTYTVNITDANGCVDSASVTITQSPQLTASASGTSVACAGQKDTLTSTNSGGTKPYEYAWGPSGGNGSTAIVSPTTSTTYTLTITDVNGCTATTTVALNVDPSPAAEFNATPDTVNIGGTVNFINQTMGNNTYYWNFGDGTTSVDSAASHAYGKAGTYVVEMVATNSYGCTDSVIKDFYVEEQFKVPNVFTPGCNCPDDEFVVNATDIKTYDIKIFDRWGKKIFESTLLNDSWNGKNSSGQLESDGTYYYIVEATDYAGKNYNLDGFLQLIK